MFENWNRYYDPSTGRYLSPEPMLQSPVAVKAMAMRGMSMPAYAYANNNPIKNTDPTGNYIRVWFRSEADAILITQAQ